METRTASLNNMNKCRSLVTIIAITIIFISLIGLIGSYARIPILTTYSTIWDSMKVNSAICFLICGIVLLLMRNPKPSLTTVILTSIGIVSILIISITTLVEYLYDLNFNIDQLFIQSMDVNTGFNYVGRMAAVTAVNFTLIAFTFAYLLKKQASGKATYAVIWLILFISLFSFYNYINGVNAHYIFATYFTMPLPASILFILTILGIILTTPNTGITELFLRDTPGGYLIRRAIPCIFLIPIFLTATEVWMAKMGVLDEELGDSIIVAGIIVMFGIGMSLLARMIDREKVILTSSQTKNLQDEIIFQEFTDNIDVVFFKTSPDLSKVLYTSPAYEKIWGKKVSALYRNANDWFESILPEDKNRIHDILHDELRSYKEKITLDYRIKKPDGTIRTIHARIFQVRDANNIIFCNIGIAVDVTQINDHPT